MPYIKQESRYPLDHGGLPTTSGELNYVITKIVVNNKEIGYVHRQIKERILDYIGDKKSYTIFNEVMGVLECAKSEYLRRVGYDFLVDNTFELLKQWLYSEIIAPYEDKKIQENGDVY